MSHLIIEQGKEVGKEVTVPSAGMKFGRSPANDLVLDDDATMLFHGRFFFKSDGSLWVTDFGAGDKTTVGGAPIDEHPLKVGDLVEVGNNAFRIIQVTEKDAEPAKKPVEAKKAAPAVALDDEIDLGFKKPKKSARSAGKKEEKASGGSMSSRMMHLALIILVVVVALVVVKSLSGMSSTPARTAPKKESLALSYERVQATTKNIFRYEVELTEKGEFSVRIDDLKTNRHQVERRELSKTVIDQLSRGIESSGFFDVDSEYEEVSKTQYDLYSVTIQRNGRAHHVDVLNWTPPKEVRKATQLIEDFAVSELGISFTWMKEPEELMQLALASYKLGKARYAERDVRYGNLASSIAHFKETMLYVETIEPKPDVYEEARVAYNTAVEEQKERYEDYMFRAEKAIRLKNWPDAVKYLRILVELIQDRSDPRYEKVSTKLLNVEQHQR